MTLDSQLNIVLTTRSSKKKNQQAIGCEYSGIDLDGSQLNILPAAGAHRELRDRFIAARNGKPPWSTNAFVHTVQEIEHHDVVSSGIFADEFSNKNPRERTKQALPTLEDAMEAYMVEVLAESDM